MMKNLSMKAKSKGMLIAIVFGLLAVGTATLIGIKNTESKLQLDETSSAVLDQTASFPDESEAWQDAADATEQENTQTMTTPQDDTQSDAAKDNASDSQDDNAQSKSQSNATTLTGFVLPLEGEIINPYSNGEMVKSLTLNDWRTHDGVDIAANEATPVKACNAGSIESVENDPLWGMTVIIAHPDGSKSYYMGLSKSVSVTTGQNVALGEVIGSVGNTAEIEQALPSHLHFAMKKDGNWIDPLSAAEK